jgi:hypothetical protein
MLRMRPSAARCSAFSTTAKRPRASNGLVMASTAPVCCTNWPRILSPLALIKTTGRWLIFSSARISRQNW